MIDKTYYKQSPNIGVFSKSNNEITLVPPTAPQAFKEKVEDTLKTEIVETTICNSPLIGIFTAFNDEKILIPETVTEMEKKEIKDHFNEVKTVETKYTAIGNLVAMNNKGVAASEYIKDKIDSTELTVNESDLVGSLLFVTDEGYITHRDTSPEEMNRIDEIYQAEGQVGTVNFGDPYITAGIIGNQQGILVGSETTGPELNRIDEVFMLK